MIGGGVCVALLWFVALVLFVLGRKSAVICTIGELAVILQPQTVSRSPARASGREADIIEKRLHDALSWLFGIW